ncbi:Uncharacterised protein [Brucella neotomae]|nr:Uncharacterised protein [Brucella neotomae]
MPPIGAVDQKCMDDLRRERIAAEAGGEFEVGKPFDPVPASGNIANARGCRQRLGETANVQHTLKPVQLCQKRGGRGVEITKDIVFDQSDAMGFGKL